MNLKILKDNVCRIEFLYFLSVPIVAALICAIVSIYSEVEVLFFAIVVYLWSLAFPKLGGRDLALPSPAVDFWYYSLALIGVLLFFFANAEQREKLLLSEKYNAALARLAEFSEDKKLFTYLSNKRDILFDDIITMARQRAEQNRKDRRECVVNMVQWELERKNVAIRRPDQDSKKRLIVINQARCDAVFKVSGWDELATAQNYEQLRERAANGTPSENSLVVEGIALALPIVANYIALVPGSEGWNKEMERLDAEIEKAEQSCAAAASIYRDVGRNIDNASAFFGNITNFPWPYLLITALGMKLACKPHAYNWGESYNKRVTY